MQFLFSVLSDFSMSIEGFLVLPSLTACFPSQELNLLLGLCGYSTHISVFVVVIHEIIKASLNQVVKQVCLNCDLYQSSTLSIQSNYIQGEVSESIWGYCKCSLMPSLESRFAYSWVNSFIFTSQVVS